MFIKTQRRGKKTERGERKGMREDVWERKNKNNIKTKEMSVELFSFLQTALYKWLNGDNNYYNHVN